MTSTRKNREKVEISKRLSYRRETGATFCISFSNIGLRVTPTDGARVSSSWDEHFQQLNTLYSATCIVLYTTIVAQLACYAVRVINRLPYNQSCWCQLDRNCDQSTSTTTSVVDDTASTVMDVNHRGISWTQRFQTANWPSRSLKVTRNGAIWQATYDFLLVFNCNYVCILHHFPKSQEVTWPSTHPFQVIHELALFCINPHSVVEVPSFTDSKDTIGSKN